MLRNYAVILGSEGVVNRLKYMGPDVERAAARAVSSAAVKARTLSARRAREQVNFPAAYVAPAEGRLAVRQTSNPLVARVVARSRTTSLARFAMTKRASAGTEPGVRVQVKPGVARFMRGAFLVKLRGAGGGVDTNSANMGLAIRTRDGSAPSRAYRPVRTNAGFWLLYGPSVAQVLLSASENKGVWSNITAEVKEFFESEFFRQMELK